MAMLRTVLRRAAATRQQWTQARLNTTAASRQAELIDWVNDNHGSVSSAISISYPNAATGAGLQAAQACKAGERLVHLPARCQLTYGDNTSPELMALIEKVPQELWGAKLALQVLRERCLGTESFFRHYISNLPVGVPGIPLFFSQDAVKALEEYPPLSQQVKRRCWWLVDFADGELARLASSSVDPFQGLPIDANMLGWAMAVTTSRAFRVRGPDKPAAQLPLIDMCNHSFAPNCQVFPGQDGSVDLVASRDIQASERLLLSYGNLSNDFFLLDYGFLIPLNPFDAVAVRFDVAIFQAANALSKQKVDDEAIDSLEGFKESLLSELQLAGAEADMELMLRRSLPSCSPRAVAAARILSAQNAAELAGRSTESLGQWKEPVSPINEVKALRMLAGVAFFVLSRFPATLEQDRQLLAGRSSGLLPDDVALAVQFRLGKKQLMTELLHDLANRIKALAMQPIGRQDSAAVADQSAGKFGKRSYTTYAAAGRKPAAIVHCNGNYKAGMSGCNGLRQVSEEELASAVADCIYTDIPT